MSIMDNRHYPPTLFARFVVDEAKCNGCGLCATTCPGQLLKVQNKVPINAFQVGETALGCVGCKNCESICPLGAIQIRDYYNVQRGYYRTRLQPPEPPNPLGAQKTPKFEEIADELTEVERTIYRRRSNRVFKKKPVPEAILRRILEAGRFAPSQGNCQPWSFIVITDRDLLERIGKACESRVRPLSKLYVRKNGRNGPVRTLVVNLLQRLSPNNFDQRLAHGIDTIVSNEHYDLFLHAPAVVLVLGDQRGIGNPAIDCMLAAHNMVLTAHALGLGTCYVGFVKMLSLLPKLRRELGIRWPDKVITSLAIGYPRTRIDKAVARERPSTTWFTNDASTQ